MPLSRAFWPMEIAGRKFDRGMQLYEFDSQRKADAPLTEYVGTYKDCGRFVGHVEAFVRRRVEMVEASTPKMLIEGSLYPDAFITNHFEGWNEKALDFMRETMAQKILGMKYSEIAPGYYRAGWLPPPMILPSLRPVTFHYPACGYAGALAEMLGEPEVKMQMPNPLHAVGLNIAFCVGYPAMAESVIFVVDESPIYRVTNQDACANRFGVESRLVVEYRGECDPVAELSRLGICDDAELLGTTAVNLPLPNKENLQRCPLLFTATMNDQIIRHMLSLRSTPQPASTT